MTVNAALERLAHATTNRSTLAASPLHTADGGWRADFARLLAHSLPSRQASRASRFLKLITQTPSSL